MVTHNTGIARGFIYLLQMQQVNKVMGSGLFPGASQELNFFPSVIFITVDHRKITLFCVFFYFLIM